jgi:hypothetical protein
VLQVVPVVVLVQLIIRQDNQVILVVVKEYRDKDLVVLVLVRLHQDHLGQEVAPVAVAVLVVRAQKEVVVQVLTIMVQQVEMVALVFSLQSLVQM